MTATWIFLAVQGNVNFNPILTHGQKVLEVYGGAAEIHDVRNKLWLSSKGIC